MNYHVLHVHKIPCGDFELFTNGNEAATWPSMHRSVHSYANRLHVVPDPMKKGRGYVKSIVIFHYTLQEHAYLDLLGQFKLPLRTPTL